MGKVKDQVESAEAVQKAADDAKVREIHARLLALENPTNAQIFDLLAELPPLDLPIDPTDIIRELRGPLPGDPDAEPLPNE